MLGQPLAWAILEVAVAGTWAQGGLEIGPCARGIWEMTKNSQCWFPRVPTSAWKAFGVASEKVTSFFCPSIYLTNPKIARGNEFSLEELEIHSSTSGVKTPALAGAIRQHLPDSPRWFWEALAHVGILLCFFPS